MRLDLLQNLDVEVPTQAQTFIASSVNIGFENSAALAMSVRSDS